MKRFFLLLVAVSCIASYSPTRVQISTIPSNVVITVTTATDTGLVVNLDATSVYTVRGFIRNSCNNTGGVNFGFVSPSGAAYGIWGFGQTSSATAVTRAIYAADGIVATAFATASGAAFIYFDGKITNNATAGTLKLQFASVTSGQQNTLVALDTYFKVEKIYP